VTLLGDGVAVTNVTARIRSLRALYEDWCLAIGPTLAPLPWYKSCLISAPGEKSETSAASLTFEEE
jgi:hypothetical protein